MSSRDLAPTGPRRRKASRAPSPPQDPVKRRLLRLYTALHRRFGPQDWWPARSPFEVAVGAVLTQHTTWRSAERAIAALRRARALTPRALAGLALPALGRLVRPAGTYRVKAARLRALAAFIVEGLGGWPARLGRAPLGPIRARLLGVPGIGPETADAILLYAGHRPVFVADGYARRVLSRHGLVPPAIGYEPLRRFLETHLPRDPRLFNEWHALLVAVGKAHCRTRPRCQGCPLRWDLRSTVGGSGVAARSARPYPGVRSARLRLRLAPPPPHPPVARVPAPATGSPSGRFRGRPPRG